MDNKTYTLTLINYEFNLIDGTFKKNVSSVNGCSIYKNDDNVMDVWLTTDQDDSEIDPGMITDDSKKIYFLKNWLFNQSNYKISGNVLRISIFNNTYCETSKAQIENYVLGVLDKVSKNAENFKKVF